MDAKQDHERMCATFDEWVKDENTHWLSEHDAAYQGFMAAWEMRSDEMARQNQATRYANDLFDQMNDERKRQDAEIERLRETLTTILNYDVEGNIRATARDAINAGAWNEGNDIKSYCDEIEDRICKVLGDGYE